VEESLQVVNTTRRKLGNIGKSIITGVGSMTGRGTAVRTGVGAQYVALATEDMNVDRREDNVFDLV
jgi:hypothetical protein